MTDKNVQNKIRDRAQPATQASDSSGSPKKIWCAPC
jgi:hypothetical protein